MREVLESMCEQDFMHYSHGFRPKRSAHDAIRALDRIAHRGKANWILEADIVSFFDSLDRTKRQGAALGFGSPTGRCCGSSASACMWAC